MLTPEQRAFLDRLPPETTTVLSQAARAGTRIAIQAADAAAKLYGGQMAADMVTAMNKPFPLPIRPIFPPSWIIPVHCSLVSDNR